VKSPKHGAGSGDAQATPREALTRVDILRQPPAIHPVAAQSFDALQDAGVSWCLLRGERRLASPPHDVDILVSHADLRRATEALAGVGFAAVPTWARGSHRFFVRYEAGAGGWLQIDAVTELAYGPQYAIQTNASAGCLRRGERIGPLTILSGDDAFWTLLLHCVLDRRNVPAHQKERLDVLASLATPSGQLARFVLEAAGPDWDPRRILECVKAAEWDALDGLRTAVIKGWARRHPLRFGGRVLNGASRWKAEPVHTAMRLRGLRVAIVGPTGHEAAEVASSLAESFYFPVSVGAWDDGIAAAFRTAWRQARGRLVVLAASSREVDRRGKRRAAVIHRAARALIAPDIVVALDPVTPAMFGSGGFSRIETVEAGPAASDEVRTLVWRAYCKSRGWLSRLDHR
jgi:hypothetical protein